jgi:hypothetical protein
VLIHASEPTKETLLYTGTEEIVTHLESREDTTTDKIIDFNIYVKDLVECVYCHIFHGERFEIGDVISNANKDNK